jgi:CO/xanthine dehydrogenase FAD-binding subunit
MRAYLPSYEMKTVQSLGELLALLSASPGEWRPFAGGTDLMVLFEAGKLTHKKFVSIWGIPELKKTHVETDRIELGALTTYSQLQKNEIIQKEFPILVQSSGETGAIAIQNRGTLGGNIANASPAADSSPGLLAYDAVIELVSQSGSRQVPYRDFHLGYKKTALKSDELVSKIILPRNSDRKFHYFRKVGTRKAQAISKTCISGVAIRGKGFRVGFGSVGPVPILLVLEPKKPNQSDQQWLTEVEAELKKKITPIDDIRSTGEYRLRVSTNLLTDFLKTASREV